MDIFDPENLFPEETAPQETPVFPEPEQSAEFNQPESPFAPEETAPVQPEPVQTESTYSYGRQPQQEPWRVSHSQPHRAPYTPPQNQGYTPPQSYVPPQSQGYSAPRPESASAAEQEPRKKASPYANSPYVMNTPRPSGAQYQPQTQPRPKPPKAPKEKKRGVSAALAVLLTLVLVAGGCLVTGYAVNLRWQAQADAMDQRMMLMQQQLDALQQTEPPAAQAPSGAPVASGTGMTPAQVYARNVDSVVAISVTVQGYSYGQVVEGASSGSGFILTEDGYVVTNYHVVENGTSVTVVMHDETELPAKVVGYDATNDVAVLKVEATGLPAVTLGSSSALNVGDMVVAIGNPLGELNATQTVGYICGKDREVTTGGTIINMLQTDAAINPGNSGGPLFNMNGEVVGITTAKYSGTTSSGASIEGIGFAIPVDDVMRIINDLQNYGYVTGAYLGVTVQNVSEEVASLGITGAVIRSVEPGYAADKAGIRAKDIIIGVDGHEIATMNDLTRILRNYNAGDSILVTLLRSGVKMELTVTLDERPRDLNQPSTTPTPDPEAPMPGSGDYEEWYDYFFGDK